MGEIQLDEILFIEDLISSKLFDSPQAIYNTPDSVLPRVRRNNKIIRPLRFYRSDVERLFSRPGEAIALREPRSLKIEVTRETEIARPSIQFKKRRK
jgi:hypothetical protein